MSAPVLFPRKPVRAIRVYRVGSDERWMGRFAGDRWTHSFRTEIGSRWRVLQLLSESHRVRCGLPIIADADDGATLRRRDHLSHGVEAFHGGDGPWAA